MKINIDLKTLAEATGCEIIKGSPDIPFDSFITDSRKLQSGDFFWALKGENFDANSPELLAKTLPAAKGWIIRKDILPQLSTDKMPESVLAAGDTLKAMQNLALWYRKRFEIPVVSMTGSNGKSTTKEMMRSILSLKGRTCCNKGNFNNQLGVPLSILELQPDDEYGVFELGASHPGDIDEIAALSLPSVGIITNVAPSHLEFFGTLENVYKTKTEIVRHIKDGGILIYNADDKFLSRLEDTAELKTLSGGKNIRIFSFGHSENAYIRVLEDGSLLFRDSGETIRPKLPYPGAHNLMNAAAAAAAAFSMGISPETIKKGLEGYSAPAMRMQEFKTDRGASVILDAYNANPQSMAAAFAEMKSRPRPLYFMLGDMRELGATSEHYHRELGRSLAEIQPDGLFLAGKEMAAAADEYVKCGGKNLVYGEKLEEWLEEARKLVYSSEKGTFLIKASRSLKFERITQKMETNENRIFDWAESVSFAVTICNENADVIYMNAKSRLTFEKHGDMIGKNLKDCHPPHAWAKIQHLLATGESNSYHILKEGVKKFIHQTPWYKPGSSKPAGLVEISVVIPLEIPCYERKPAK